MYSSTVPFLLREQLACVGLSFVGIGVVLAIALTGVGGIIIAVLGAVYFLYNILTKDSFKNTKDKVKKA